MAELTILGGGAAGLGVAFYAHRAGRSFALYEKSDELGGMCRTFWHGRHRFDAGAHRFHDRDAEVTADLRALLGPDLRPVRAPSQVWAGGRFMDFPPTPLGAALSYGVLGALGIGLELLTSRSSKPAANFEEFAYGRFGVTLAREVLLNYAEKLWGLPADELSPDVATRRLQGMTLRTLIREVFAPASKTAHIDGEFLYPRLGYGQIAESLAAAVTVGSLRTGCPVAGFEVRGGRISRIHLGGRGTVSVDGRVVSTLPVTLLVRLLADGVSPPARDAARSLRFRQVRLVFLRLAQASVSPNASIYIPEPRFCVSRVSEPRNRSAELSPEGETSLLAEVPCFPGDALDRLMDAELAARVVADLGEIGLVRRDRVVEWRHVLLPYAYPVYSLGYDRAMSVMGEALSSIKNLDTIGRAGAFHYSHLHDQLRCAKEYVGRLPVPA